MVIIIVLPSLAKAFRRPMHCFEVTLSNPLDNENGNIISGLGMREVDDILYTIEFQYTWSVRRRTLPEDY